MEIIKRMEAAELALKRYYTGTVCNRGHLAERYTASGNCVECSKKSSGAYAQALKAAAHAAGETIYKRTVPTVLVETLDAVIQAHNLTVNPEGLCPHGKSPTEFCVPCDTGL